MKMRTLLKHQQLDICEYPHPLNEHGAKWDQPDISSLLDYTLLDQSVPLNVDGKIHQVHVTILVGHTAVIFRGMDDQIWETPTLCFDGKALCYELHLWRVHAAFDPQSSPSTIDRSNDLKITTDPEKENDEFTDAAQEAVSDPFFAIVSDLAYNLEALSLIESLPKVR